MGIGLKHSKDICMRKIFSIVLSLVLISSVVDAQTKVRDDRPKGITFEKEQSPPQSVKTRVVFWTNQKIHGKIKVYVNNHYVGSITKAYNSAPNCGASGCVTVTISGKNNQWYGEASDGTRWYSGSATLVRGCNAIRLYSSGRSSSNQSGGQSTSAPSPSSSENKQGKDSWKKELATSSAQAWSDVYGSAMMEGVSIPKEGVPYFAVQAGYSRFCEGFVGLKYRTSGFCGLSLLGNWGFIKGDYGYPWELGVGACFDRFAWDIRFGKTSLCPNYGLLTGISYDWYFIPQMAVSANVGFGYADLKKKKPELIWTWGISLSYNIWYR